MRVGVGGTFNVLHKGHELLFETAFTVGDSVEVGLTSDELAKSIKSVPVAPYFQRKKNLAKYLARFGKPFDIVMISDSVGTAATSETLDAIVVSPETRSQADRINELRRRNGLKPLKVFPIKEVRADDSRLISASRIVKGEIDKEGRLLHAVRVAVGSTNKVKVDAVRNIFTQALGLVEVRGIGIDQTGDKQPLGEKTIRGAVRRAKQALSSEKADFGVGIEAGLFYNRTLGRYLDIQYCAIVDSSGRMTVGHGPGFEYPPEVIAAVLKGATVGDTMSRITEIERIGHKMGSVGYLSDGLIDRTSLTEIAVLMALIPRIRPELYDQPSQASSAVAAR
ncbi:MAG: inosine/xanthosine triphosphatase [Candidatus Thermoplasmatota archaeon]|nr:inosine/xanthosine triphosphatase [Candidatus Thermoplasmatota archaeon]